MNIHKSVDANRKRCVKSTQCFITISGIIPEISRLCSVSGDAGSTEKVPIGDSGLKAKCTN